MGTVSFGFALGFCTGYSVKMFGEALLLILGSQVMLLQFLAREKIVIIDWEFIQTDISKTFHSFNIGDIKNALDFNMNFTAPFGAGFIIGFQWV